MVEMETILVGLSNEIDWPETDLRVPIRARLETGTRVTPVVPRRVKAVAIAAAVIAVVLATPQGRQAVADLISVTGITIRWGEAEGPVGAEFDLGEVVAIGVAARGVAFPILEPAEAPDTIYLDDVPAGGAVHMVWRGDSRLPASHGTDVGTLYSQFQVTGSEVFVKSLDETVTVRRVEVRGHEGFWIEGAPHYIFYKDALGADRQEEARLAGNVLAWEEGGVTHRIETTGSLEEALRLASTLSQQLAKDVMSDG